MNDFPSRFLVNVAPSGDDLPPGFVVNGQQPKRAAYRGALIPMSVDEDGNVSFDSDAGILGGLKSAFTLPGDVMEGRARVPQSSAMPGGESTENIGRVLDLATTVSPVNPGITAGDRAIPGVLKATRVEKPVVPTTEELDKIGAADLKAPASKFDATSSSAANHSRKVQREFFDDGIGPVEAPKTFEELKAVEDVPPDSVFTASNLQSLRDSFKSIAEGATGADRDAAIRAIKRFDQYLPEIDEASVLAGSPAATQKLFERGYGNRDAAQRSNGLTGELDRAATGISERAEARAQSAANPGRSLDDSISSKADSLFKRPKEVSGYSDAEIAALNRTIAGGVARREARRIGYHLAGGSPARPTLAAIGGGIGTWLGDVPGGIIGAAVPTGVGLAAKSIANVLAKRDLNKAAELMRMRSPLYQERVANPQISIITPDAIADRAAIARTLLLEALHQKDKR